MKTLIPFLLTLSLGLWACGESTPQEAQADPAPTETAAPATRTASRATLRPEVLTYAESVIAEFDQIPEERQRALKKIALYIETQQSINQPAQLTFICTHNSRRSHMSQIWASAAAAYYGVEGVKTFSGGTEATAFNPRAVKAMQEIGFPIEVAEAGDNPVYAVAYAEEKEPIRAYSKKYDAEENPTENFCAVMTCSQADKNCPNIPGASLRVAIPYEDPKNFDGTEQEAEKYAERAHQIAREMFYLFSQINA
jgi:arsenate reductase (thioredoxin)